MKVLAGNKYNLLSWTLNTTAKTLTINNAIGIDLTPASLDSVYDSTTATYFSVGKNITSCVFSYVAGLPVWVYTFTTLPAGAANTDTLIILLEVPEQLAAYTVALYQASKV